MIKGASIERTRGVLIVKKLNKCIVSILVYNLFLNKQRNLFYIYGYIDCLHEI